MATHPALAVALLLGLAPAGLAHARVVPVRDAAGLVAAVVAAQPGDEIVLANGTYELSGSHGVNCTGAGTPEAPIVVRAAHPFGAHVVSKAVEAFSVGGPNWRFEGLDVRGACADDAQCEHAFHVTGRATGFQLLGSRVADFNAHLKVNADGSHAQPDGGLVDGNEFLNTHPRRTDGPVTPVNIDVAADWVVRGNVIRDFHKAGGNEVSYGAYAKGGALRPLFERNLVLCADQDTAGGTRIGLSLGGGGMDAALCAPRFDAAKACDPEVEGGIIRNNIVASCSDDGIYLNRAHDTKLLYNTLVATGGIAFRFASSQGEAVGNVMSSGIHDRDGGRSTGEANLVGVSPEQFAAWFQNPAHGDLRRKGDPGPLVGRGLPRPDLVDDYCGRPRAADALDLGAIQVSAGDCMTTRPAAVAALAAPPVPAPAPVRRRER